MRKSISKSLRFEIFKRDNFKCVYCGSNSSSTILECDHVIPVSKGGDNDPLNLVTSCIDCNRGKSGRELFDQTSLAIKQELAKIKKIELDKVSSAAKKSIKNDLYKKEIAEIYINHINEKTDFYNSITYEFKNSDHQYFYKLHKKYGKDSLLKSIAVSIDQYYIAHGIDFCLEKIPGILFNWERAQADPLYNHYCRARARVNKKWTYVDRRLKEYFYLLCEKHTPESVVDFCASFRNWSSFRSASEEIFNG